MKTKSLLLILCLLISTSGLAQRLYQNEWTYMNNPEDKGWNDRKMNALGRYVRDSSFITGLMIIQKGQVVYDYGDLTENSYIASCRKSVLAMLYGKYVENGTIGLNKTIGEMGLTDVDGILEREKKADIQDIISARSGVYHREGYPGGMQQFAPERGSVEPGSYWLYSNWDFNVAGYIFEEETGKNIYDEVETQLAIPLQMQDWQRGLQEKQGNTSISKYLAYPMWFSTRDMARIGQLMLNKGAWNGKQIISKSWVKEILAQRTTSEEIHKNVPVFRDLGVNYGYGYMWWLYENMNDRRFIDAYVALGAMGQAIAVFPEIDVVIAYKTKAAYRRSNSGKVRQEVLLRAVRAFDSAN